MQVINYAHVVWHQTGAQVHGRMPLSCSIVRQTCAGKSRARGHITLRELARHTCVRVWDTTPKPDRVGILRHIPSTDPYNHRDGTHIQVSRCIGGEILSQNRIHSNISLTRPTRRFLCQPCNWHVNGFFFILTMLPERTICFFRGVHLLRPPRVHEIRFLIGFTWTVLRVRRQYYST